MTEPEVQIRRAAPADAAPLAELAARIFVDTFAADTAPDDLAAHLAKAYGERQQSAEIANPELITLVAEAGGALVAYAQVGRFPPPECVTGEDPVEIARFYVDHSWHGRGLARRLMAAARDAARELGGRSLWLGVWERNGRAIAFYEKEGFRGVGTHDFWVGSDCQTDLVMAGPI
jgi:ribosomal protein S18 acetylase RimI-like enzyme